MLCQAILDGTQLALSVVHVLQSCRQPVKPHFRALFLFDIDGSTPVTHNNVVFSAQLV